VWINKERYGLFLRHRASSYETLRYSRMLWMTSRRRRRTCV